MALGEHGQQLGMHLLESVPNRFEPLQQNRIGLPQSKKHFGPRRRQLAVAQVGDLRVVHPTEIQGLRQSRQHLVRPTVALMPHMHEMGHGTTTIRQPLPMALAQRINA